MRARPFTLAIGALTLLAILGCGGATGTCVSTYANGDPDHCYQDESESFCTDPRYDDPSRTRTFTANATCRDLGYDCAPARAADAHMRCADLR